MVCLQTLSFSLPLHRSKIPPPRNPAMKTSLARFLLLALISALASCASVNSLNSGNTVKVLSDAGFTRKVPETARQKELYAAADSYKVKSITSGGKTFYAYKDEKSGVAYIGSEKNYQEYRRLAEKQKIAREQYEATRMRGADGWYGSYSPYNPYRNIGYNRYP